MRQNFWLKNLLGNHYIMKWIIKGLNFCTIQIKFYLWYSNSSQDLEIDNIIESEEPENSKQTAITIFRFNF